MPVDAGRPRGLRPRAPSALTLRVARAYTRAVMSLPLAGFRDRVAVVTGGGSGIGQALALALAREGAHVVVADVDEAGMAETCRAVAARGGDALAVRTDVADPASVQALADRAFARFGAVHVLCNNAGVVVHGGLEAATLADWQWVIGVNLWGVIHGLLAFLPRMIAQHQGGHVVNTASMAGLIASQGLGVYNTSKYAVVGLSETLAKDLRPHGLGVSIVCPMGVASRIREAERARPAALRNPTAAAPAPPVTLIGRTLSPGEVAEQVVDALRAGELYVITHEEGLDPLRRRSQRLEDAVRRTAARRRAP
jgi:NAD(P)-dependent dehydrogenase (short-subunit alcohol dehydrogenase family)